MNQRTIEKRYVKIGEQAASIHIISNPISGHLRAGQTRGGRGGSTPPTGMHSKLETGNESS